ncbi:ParA family protein [Methylobacterium sp. C1]|uniref:ParA family protein n=1 Tax=Methylobacterium sp. C1 TaxID=1479019 RepID=UPI0009F35DEB|nr:ParA family protein [Methylobacterium sp. C1]
MKTVALVNMKGGVAKTTLATNLANSLARRHSKRILLIDTDPQFNATQCVFSPSEYVKRRSEGAHTILNVFNDAAHTIVSPVEGAVVAPAVKLEDIVPWKSIKGFDIIPGDLELYRLDMGAGQGREQRLKRFLEKIKADTKYDFVLIDTPPTPSPWMMSALLASDAYLVPVKPEPLSTVGIDLLRGVVNRCSENHGHDISCLGVVLTSVDARTLVFDEAKAFLDQNAAWKGKRFAAHMPHRTKIARNQGRQVMILGSDLEDAKLALTKITNEFLERIKNV